MAIRISGTTGIDMGNTSVSNVDVGVLEHNAVNRQYVDDSKIGFVKLTGDDTIAGIKTFSSNIVGNITGNADTATTLATARTINGVAFDGTANIIVPVSDDSAVNLTENQTIGGIKTFSSIISGNISGNSATATKLATARTINGVSFDGSANITVSDSIAVKLTGNETIGGIKTFTSSPIVPTPSTDFQVANKQYVDSKTLNINALSNKASPINTDTFVLQEAGGNLRKVNYENLIKLNSNDIVVKAALNASGDAPIYACRAWVNFDGTGTVAIRASGNVSSITDNGVGDFTVNFTTAMPDANYTCSGMAPYGNDPVNYNDGIVVPYILNTINEFRVRTTSASTNKGSDSIRVMLIFHR